MVTPPTTPNQQSASREAVQVQLQEFEVKVMTLSGQELTYRGVTAGWTIGDLKKEIGRAMSETHPKCLRLTLGTAALLDDARTLSDFGISPTNNTLSLITLQCIRVRLVTTGGEICSFGTKVGLFPSAGRQEEGLRYFTNEVQKRTFTDWVETRAQVHPESIRTIALPVDATLQFLYDAVKAQPVKNLPFAADPHVKQEIVGQVEHAVTKVVRPLHMLRSWPWNRGCLLTDLGFGTGAAENTYLYTQFLFDCPGTIFDYR